jgi:hypothetical protein
MKWWRKNRQEIPSVPEKEPEVKEMRKEVNVETWYRDIPGLPGISVLEQDNKLTIYNSGYISNYISMSKTKLKKLIQVLKEEGVI